MFKLYKNKPLMSEIDRLEAIFECQKSLQTSFGFSDIRSINQVKSIKDTILSLTSELHEILNLFPWREWRNNGEHQVDQFHLKEEVADALHFFINLCLICEITPQDLFDSYMDKNLENLNRIKNGTNKTL